MSKELKAQNEKSHNRKTALARTTRKQQMYKSYSNISHISKSNDISTFTSQDQHLTTLYRKQQPRQN